MKLPSTLREAILDTIDQYVDTVDEPDTETVVEYVLEQVELIGEEIDQDDLIGTLEEEAGLPGTLMEALTEAFETSSNFVFTGEEVASTFEQLCSIEWNEVDD